MPGAQARRSAVAADRADSLLTRRPGTVRPTMSDWELEGRDSDLKNLNLKDCPSLRLYFVRVSSAPGLQV